MTATLERARRPRRSAQRPMRHAAPTASRGGVVRRFSIQATRGNRYLILDGDGLPVPTLTRDHTSPARRAG